MHLTPGLLLAILGVLLFTQLTRLAAARGPYLLTLALAAAGMASGEVVAGQGHLAAGSMGALHPLLDLPLMGALELAGVVAMNRSPAGRR